MNQVGIKSHLFLSPTSTISETQLGLHTSNRAALLVQSYTDSLVAMVNVLIFRQPTIHVIRDCSEVMAGLRKRV